MTADKAYETPATPFITYSYLAHFKQINKPVLKDGAALAIRTVLSKILVKEAFQLVKRNDVFLIIQVGMYCTRDNHQFFIGGVLAVFCHSSVGILAEVAGLRFFTMHDQNRIADLIGIGQLRYVHKRHTADLIPAAV